MTVAPSARVRDDERLCVSIGWLCMSVPHNGARNARARDDERLCVSIGWLCRSVPHNDARYAFTRCVGGLSQCLTTPMMMSVRARASMVVCAHTRVRVCV